MWGLEGVCASQWASEESLGFVVWMPVILLLASSSLSSIYRAVFTLGWDYWGEDLWLPAMAGDSSFWIHTANAVDGGGGKPSDMWGQALRYNNNGYVDVGQNNETKHWLEM